MGGVCACAAFMLIATAPGHAATEEGAVRAPAEERSNKAARLAQALERQEEARTAERGPGGTWEALRQWLALSDRAYQALIQRLARGAEKTAHAAAPVMPLAREENVDAGARFWWWRGRGLFDAMMRRLAEGGAPPESAPTHPAPTPPVAEQGAARSGTAGPPVSAAAVATAHVPDQGPDQGPVATGPGARDDGKGSAGADRAGAPPARLAVVPPARRPAASSATLAAGGARSDTGKQVAERRAQRARLRGHARSASKPRHAAWHGSVHATGYAARYAAWRMADGALRAKQRRGGMRRVAAHRVHRCAQAGRRGPLPGWYVVAKGDTLWQIARRHYGSGRRYVRIAAANRHRLRGRDRIVPCQRLFLPRASRRH